MSGRNITSLPAPPRQYLVDRACPDFETVPECQAEDARRSRALLRTIAARPLQLDVCRATRLARSLMLNGTGSDEIETLASRVYMRTQRINVPGALWQLVDSEPGCTTCTIIGRSWEVAPEVLWQFDLTAALAAFRADLYRAGLAEAVGWLFAAWHGEYDPIANVFRLHLHIVCNAAMVPVIDRLRPMANYVFAQHLPDGSWDPVYRRIRINRQPLHSLPNPLTYLLQSFWPSRPILVTEDGRRNRVRQKRSIPEPYRSMVLTWLDRWSLQDITLLVGLRVTGQGLIRTGSAYTNYALDTLAEGR